MTSEITNSGASQDAGSASEITNKITKRGPGARPTALPGDFAEIIDDYAAALNDAPLSAESRRTYLSRVRMYLAWLTEHRPPHTTGDPITSPRARDWAVRDYRLWLLRDRPDKRSVVYANSALTAIDDFYTRRGLGKAAIERDELPETAPRALAEQARIRWLRAVEAHLSPRDRTLAPIPYYAGARISEVVRLNVTDVHRSARKAQLQIWGKGGKPRTIQIHKKLRVELDQWLEERPNWPHAGHNPALFLNTKGARLTTRPPAASSTPSPTTPHSTTNPPLTCSVTPWRQHSSAATPPWSSSPSCSATPASRQPAGTACPPKKTRQTPSTSSPSTADQREPPHRHPLPHGSRTRRHSHKID